MEHWIYLEKETFSQVTVEAKRDEDERGGGVGATF